LKKNPLQKRPGGVAQGIHPEFKFQHQKQIEFSARKMMFMDWGVVQNSSGVEHLPSSMYKSLGLIPAL
jgi:hypothetical protein